jgi:AcrR family transcriptional regulator
LRILAAVSRGFRKRGYGGIGVDGLAKEAAVKEAVVAGLDELRESIETLRFGHGVGWVEAFVDFYLGYKRTCDLGDSCTLQSLSPEVQRSDSETKAAYEANMIGVAQAVADGLSGNNPQDRLQRAWALLAILSGGVTLARAVEDQATSKAIATAVRKSAVAAVTRV